MHIAITTPEFVTEKDFGAGLANYTANIARILSKNGHRVSVFVASTENATLIWEEGITVYRVLVEDLPDKIKSIKIKYVQRILRYAWNLLGKSFLINRRIRSVNEKDKIDVVHFCSSEALAMFKNKKIPAVVRLSTYLPMVRHSQLPIFDYEKSLNSLNLIEILQLIAARKGDYIFAPSNVVANLTEQKIRKSIAVIESPFYINAEQIDYMLYKKFFCEKNYFIFYGTLCYIKGIHTIAHVLNRFFEACPNYYFIFVGYSQKIVFDNEKIDAMEYIYRFIPQFHDKVFYFPATKNKEQLYGLVKNACACVLPSRFDNLPNTCIESMALGQIVIGTNGASFEQLIDDGVNGFLIERENEAQLYDKMVKVTKLSQDERKNICKRAKETVERLRPEKIYPQVVEIYEKAIKKKDKK